MPAKKSCYKASLVLLLGLSIYLLWQSGLLEFDRESWSVENLKAQVDSFGYFGPLVFMLAYYVAALLFISFNVLTILSGLLFGKIWGSIYAIIAATLCAQTAFLISRKLSSNRTSPLGKNKIIQKLVQIIESKSEKNGLLNVITLRALLPPYIPFSYAAGTIKGIGARDFFWGTFLTNLAIVPAFVYLGESLLNGPKALIVPAIVLFLIWAVPKVFQRFQSH